MHWPFLHDACSIYIYIYITPSQLTYTHSLDLSTIIILLQFSKQQKWKKLLLCVRRRDIFMEKWWNFSKIVPARVAMVTLFTVTVVCSCSFWLCYIPRPYINYVMSAWFPRLAEYKLWQLHWDSCLCWTVNCILLLVIFLLISSLL